MFKHETIQCDSILPAKITMNDSSVDRCRGEPHWHEEIQLIYVDEGSLNMTVGNRKSALNAGDVQMINPCEVHSLMTIMGYAIKERTKHALGDYLTHDIPIGEAAKKNGFCHYNHFTKACHKYYGASPTEIKRQKRQRDAAPNAPLVKSA